MTEAIYGHKFTNINSNGNTLVKSGQGVLRSITFNKKGASSNTATLYDGTDNTGTVIGVIDTTDKISTLLYDLKFFVGLYIVTATGTCADMTVATR